MKDMLIENVEYIAMHVGDDVDVAAWIADADFEALNDLEPDAREAISYSYGYLRGAADYADCTVSQLLDAFEIDVAAVAAEAKEQP